MGSQKLIRDDSFVPCPVEEKDELYQNGIFVFNITHMHRYLRSDEAQIPISEAQVSDFPRYTDCLDQAYVDSTDLQRPVILAEIAPGRLNVIDGNHRMEKARKNSVETLPCYRVTPEVHTHFLTSQRAYDAYIDYWNEKLDG